jgi:soluble lytic murein transglycosylase
VLRVVFVALLLVLGMQSVAAQVLPKAMEAVRAKDWAEAERLVRRENAVTQDIVEWHRLRAGEGTSQEAMAFLKRRADWPGLPYLRRQMEARFEDAPADRVIAFFAAQDPRTAEGAYIHARALEAKGQSGAAEAGIVLAWRTMSMSEDLQAAYLAAYGKVLKDHHVARLDYTLWKGWKDNAQRMYPLVSDGWRKLAAARLALRQDRTGVDSLIKAVPATLAGDPGLAYERFLWRAVKGRSESAIDLLVSQSKAGQLGEPLPWAERRQIYARSEMRAGRHQQAYDIASTHGLVEGSKFADLEWLSGYLALRFLKKPETALHHFIRFEQAVETPISWGRAGYWIGRAYDALGDKASAQRAYMGAAQHQTSFYGLLAAEKAGVALKPDLAGVRASDWRGAPFTRTSVHDAALLFLKADELWLAERFWTHLAETQDQGTMAQMGQMAIDMGQPHIAVMLGKRFVRYGEMVHAPYYALHPMAKRRDLPVPAEMALSIARRESEFDPMVVSGANAQGLMQILPGTAKQVAGALGLPYNKSRLLTDEDYNVTLGTAYLAGLAEEFDGNVILVSAGYNAGPSRPIRWMSERGDPRRRGGMDMIDWIEHIPFTETRNYVMRVAESLPIYRARLGKDPLPIPFSKELVGRTLLD